MKSVLVLASFAVAALAQQASIVLPPAGSTVTSGKQLKITVHQDSTNSEDHQISIVLGLVHCFTGSCDGYDPLQSGVGQVLFQGPFTPAHGDGAPRLGLHQNFTVQVPDTPSGAAVLTLAHFHMVGAQHIPILQGATTAVKVVTSASDLPRQEVLIGNK